MKKRCIMIFPKFDNIEVIDKIREKFDPLASHVRPHITLVFPFNSDIAIDELKEHILNIIKTSNRFELVLQGIKPVNSFGKYLFLNITKGNEEIVELHKKLYSGILEPYYPAWLKNGNFMPHMTVGLLNTEEEFETAAKETRDINDEFRTIVSEVSVEIIDENEDSIIELNLSID